VPSHASLSSGLGHQERGMHLRFGLPAPARVSSDNHGHRAYLARRPQMSRRRPSRKPPARRFLTSAGWRQGIAVRAMAKGAATLLARLQEDGEVDAVRPTRPLGGTFIGTAAMRALPFGAPKLMLSTVTSQRRPRPRCRGYSARRPVAALDKTRPVRGPASGHSPD
jgi:hypothetical protein